MNRLANKVAVITGAGGGIGRAAARAFIAEGATVGVLDRDAASVEALVRELGPATFPLVADVADEASVARAFDEVGQRDGRLDVLYNCAAVQMHDRDARVDRLELEVWTETIRINLILQR